MSLPINACVFTQVFLLEELMILNYIELKTLFFYNHFFLDYLTAQLFTSDATWGDSSIPGIENGRALREKIRKVVEINREHKGVSEVDYYATAAPMPLR